MWMIDRFNKLDRLSTEVKKRKRIVLKRKERIQPFALEFYMTVHVNQLPFIVYICSFCNWIHALLQFYSNILSYWILKHKVQYKQQMIHKWTQGPHIFLYNFENKQTIIFYYFINAKIDEMKKFRLISTRCGFRRLTMMVGTSFWSSSWSYGTSKRQALSIPHRRVHKLLWASSLRSAFGCVYHALPEWWYCCWRSRLYRQLSARHFPLQIRTNPLRCVFEFLFSTTTEYFDFCGPFYTNLKRNNKHKRCNNWEREGIETKKKTSEMKINKKNYMQKRNHVCNIFFDMFIKTFMWLNPFEQQI